MFNLHHIGSSYDHNALMYTLLLFLTLSVSYWLIQVHTYTYIMYRTELIIAKHGKCGSTLCASAVIYCASMQQHNCSAAAHSVYTELTNILHSITLPEQPLTTCFLLYRTLLRGNIVTRRWTWTPCSGRRYKAWPTSTAWILHTGSYSSSHFHIKDSRAGYPSSF